ncbi:MAG: SH3 domain-containing protein [Rhodobacterales bacterium]
MKRFILLNFAFLAWCFYVLSGGADYEPREGSRQAEALKARAAAETRLASMQEDTPPEQTATANDPALLDDTDTVTRNAVEIAGIVPEFLVLDKAADMQADTILPQTVAADAADLAEEGNARLANLTLAEPAAFAQAAGYAPTSEEAEQIEPARDLRRITGTSVNMRAGPGTGYGVMGRVTRGTEVEVLESYNAGWLRLRVVDGSSVGWVAASLVSANQG